MAPRHSHQKAESSSEEDQVRIPQNLWVASTSSTSRLETLVTQGFLLAQTILGWRAKKGAALPLPNAKDLVVFESFCSHGFGLLTSVFFRQVLKFYQIDLVNLNPNSILHLSIFIHLCETFLGIPFPSLYFAISSN